VAQSILDIDLETFSEVPIANGTYRYAEKAEIMLTAWGIDGGPVSVVDEANGEKRCAELREALADPHVLVRAHNSFFDRTVLNYTGTHVALHRWRDTMVQALAHSMPGALGTLCEILGVDADKAKDKEGRALLMLFCKPRPKSMKLRRATKQTHPVEWDQFIHYAGNDILAMREVAAKLPNWNYKGSELALWHLDQRINDRGFTVDMDLVHGAIRGVARAQAILAARTQELTDDEVQRATQRDLMLRHILSAYGVDLPDLTKSTLERRINDESLPSALRELLAIRLDASTTSTSKYKTLLKATGADGRLRGTLQFDGASRTGRWAGRMFQPQNLPRPTLKQKDIDAGIAAMKADCEDLIAPNVMALTSSCVRGAIIAPEGKKLVVADLSNIEGRMLAWLAGEEWKLQAFRDFDACKGADGLWYSGNEIRDAVFKKNPIALELDKKGEPTRRGHDLYALAYAKAFRITAEMVMENKKNGDGSMRQIGKVMELALGFEGGVGAFITFALVYNIDLEALADLAFDGIAADIMAEAKDMLAWARKKKRSTFGLSDKAFLVCESFKRLWRYAHPNIASFWKDTGDAVRKAIQQPGVTFTVRMLKIQRKGAWLKIQLPSGRMLCYPSPRVEAGNQITYMGVHQYSRKWGRLKTYGGKLVENITQAAARDVIAHNMPRIDDAGYEILLTVHDEDITEAPDTEEFSADHLAALMSTNPEWCPDLPLAATGFEAYSYRKD
jgi:DNA polymerase